MTNSLPRRLRAKEGAIDVNVHEPLEVRSGVLFRRNILDHPSSRHQYVDAAMEFGDGLKGGADL